MLLFQLFTFVCVIMILKNHHLNQNHVVLGAVFCKDSTLPLDKSTGEAERAGMGGRSDFAQRMEWQNCEWKLCYKSVLPSGQHHPLQELKSLLLSWQEAVHSLNISLESPGTPGYLW